MLRTAPHYCSAIRNAALSVALLLALTSSAHAQLLAYEPFNYSAGTGFNSIPTTATGFTGSVRFEYELPVISTIGSGSLYYDDGVNALPTSSNYYYNGHGALFENFDTTGAFASYLRGSAIGANGTTLYMSVLIKIVGPQNNFAGFALSRGGDPDANRVLSIDTWTGHTSSDYFVTKWSPTNIDAGDADLGFVNQTSNLFVLRFDFGNSGTDTVSVYANPQLGVQPGSPTAQLTGSDFSFDRMDIRDFGAFTISADEIRVGTTYASVAPIPEPGETTLLAGAATLALAALRRRALAR